MSFELTLENEPKVNGTHLPDNLMKFLQILKDYKAKNLIGLALLNKFLCKDSF